MPGHSGAFARALKVDMQSPAGLAAVKAILRELVVTYHFPFIHIGGDEVRITDTTFLPSVDPLESVVTIFNRQIGGVDARTARIIGATLCLWNDRAVASENDLLRMNPVYPGMLAFAERSWRGGGKSGWVTGIGEPGTKRAAAFAEFEGRLLDQRRENLAGL
ncbi:MAG TPA: hypothetical protein VKU83_11230 [Puia sp.]|nr:hypothetical protein [Puia sp.]